MDDLLLFMEAPLENVEIKETCLKLFGDSYGQKINASKTRFFFSLEMCIGMLETKLVNFWVSK